MKAQPYAPKRAARFPLAGAGLALTGGTGQTGTVNDMTANAAHAPLTGTGPATLTRDGEHFRLTFGFDRALVDAVKTLPYAAFDGATRSWTVFVCAQAVDGLRQMYYRGMTDRPVDQLLAPGEDPAPCARATLRAGSARRPFLVATAMRDNALYERLRTIETSQWEKQTQAVSFGYPASAKLGQLVDEGILADPHQLLSPAGPAGVSVAFDGQNGKFVCRGDVRAQPVFDEFFPGRDVVHAWKGKGLEVAFADPFTEEVYRGELARLGPGLQPDGMRIPLHPYQATTVAMAVERTGLGIWHEMGLGKTPCAIGTGLELLNRGEVTRAVIVVPGAVKTQWREEIVKFTHELRDDIVVIKGTPKQRHAGYERAMDARWVIVNYDLLGRDLNQLLPVADGALIVADEAHRLKNWRSQRAQAAGKLAKRAARRIVMTGTPVMNDAAEWFAMLDFAVPGCLGTWMSYGTRYMYPARYGGRGAFEGLRAHTVPELRARSNLHFIRYTKPQVAKHLPPLTVQHMPLDPTPAYGNMLRRLHRDARDEIAKQRRGKAAAYRPDFELLDEDMMRELETGAEMTAVGMLRMACMSPRLLRSSDSPAAKALIESGLVPDEDGPKVDEIRVVAHELQAAGQRAVVFAFSTRMIDLVAERFTEDGIRFVSFTGDMNGTDRDAAVAAFCAAPTDEEPGPTIFLATDAAGEGLNLSAQCSLVLNLDLPWTVSALQQRSARIHRINSTHAAYRVVNLTVTGTLEAGLLQMLEAKADLADALLGERGGRAKSTGRGGVNLFEQAMSSWSDKVAA